MNNDIAVLVEQIKQFPERQSELKEELRETIKDYVQQQYIEGGSVISPMLLHELDELYDLPGAHFALAEALTVDLGELREMLGRKRWRTCVHCGGAFEVFETRVKGGYKEASRPKCDDCQRDEREEQQVAHEHAHALEKRKVEIDAKLISIDTTRSVQLPEVEYHLREYVRFWLGDRDPGLWALLTGFWFDATVTGCMVCNHHPFAMFIIKDGMLDEHSDNGTVLGQLADHWVENEKHVRQHGGDDLQPFVPLVHPMQLLWRYKPSEYFTNVQLLPLVEQPILFLCTKHAEIADGTHFNPYPNVTYPQSLSEEDMH